MASRFEVEVKVSSARDLKNVNWRHGPLRPYAVVWVDPNKKSSTRVDDQGDTCPHWDETLVIPVPGSIEEYSTLYIDIFHAGHEEDVSKPSSTRLKLTEVLEDVGFGEHAKRSLQLKRPSGRPHGKVDVKVEIRHQRYRAPDPYYAPSYEVPPRFCSKSLDYSAPPPYGKPYVAQPQNPNYSAPPPASYPPYGGYNTPAQAPYSAPASAPYSQPSSGQAPYGREYRQVEAKKKSNFGMGMELAMGAVAGVLGGLEINVEFEYVKDKTADDATDRVEDILDNADATNKDEDNLDDDDVDGDAEDKDEDNLDDGADTDTDAADKDGDNLDDDDDADTADKDEDNLDDGDDDADAADKVKDNLDDDDDVDPDAEDNLDDRDGDADVTDKVKDNLDDDDVDADAEDKDEDNLDDGDDDVDAEDKAEDNLDNDDDVGYDGDDY